MEQRKLSYSVIIPTYKRQEVLLKALQQVVIQTYSPKEVIIVDASPDYLETKKRVIQQIAPANLDIKWTYIQAKVLSSSVQRNLGLEAASSDIIFFMDDDSLMYPTCAEEIMRVYKSDIEGVVCGVSAHNVDLPPKEICTENLKRERTGFTTNKAFISLVNSLPIIRILLRAFYENILLLKATSLFIPYDGKYYLRDDVHLTEKLDVSPIKLGASTNMTFRRAAIRKEKFEGALIYYSSGEDLDFSYRVSRRGALLNARNAKFYHLKHGARAHSRYARTISSILNLVFFIRKNSNNIVRDRRKLKILFFRRIIAEFFKDLLRRSWTFPQVRGLLFASEYIDKMFNMSVEGLKVWYPYFQKKYFK